MDTLFKVVALDDIINYDSSHYVLEMDRERELSSGNVNENEDDRHKHYATTKQRRHYDEKLSVSSHTSESEPKTEQKTDTEPEQEPTSYDNSKSNTAPTSVPTAPNPVPTQAPTNARPLLDCKDILNLEIVGIIGEGKKKRTYEVKLPWGDHAVLKRCKTQRCRGKKVTEKEGAYLRALHEQYGSQAVAFYGECNLPYRGHFRERDISDFSAGYSSVIELGQPLLRSWEQGRSAHEMAKCISDFYTETDIEDLRNIARAYANFAEYPLLLTNIDRWPMKPSDNIFPNQYMVSRGRIHHLDLDMVFPCLKEAQGQQEECSVNNVLDMNCKVLSRLAHMPNIDCSYPPASASNTTSSSTTSRTLEKAEHFTADHQHINLTHAGLECK